MAAVTSIEKRQFILEKFQFSRDRTAPVRSPLHESKKYEMPLSLYSAKNSMPCSFLLRDKCATHFKDNRQLSKWRIR